MVATAPGIAMGFGPRESCDRWGTLTDVSGRPRGRPVAPRHFSNRFPARSGISSPWVCDAYRRPRGPHVRAGPVWAAGPERFVRPVRDAPRPQSASTGLPRLVAGVPAGRGRACESDPRPAAGFELLEADEGFVDADAQGVVKGHLAEFAFPCDQVGVGLAHELLLALLWLLLPTGEG